MTPLVKMNDITALMEGAHKIVTHCAKLKPGEKLLILTDTGTDLAISYAFMQAALEEDVEAAVITMKERDFPGEEPPPQVAAAMAVSDVIFQVTKTVMAYTQAAREARERGARFAAMTGIFPEIIASPTVIDTDFEAMKPLVEKLADMVNTAGKVRITTPAGTDLHMSLEGRMAVTCTSILDSPGCLTGLPDLEVCVAPVEDSVNGIAVVDATISSSGLVKYPVTLHIKNGILNKIEGGEDADNLRGVLEGQNNSHVYQVAELGIGLNPNAQLRGAIIEDEGKLGTVHIAVGNNILLGGRNEAPVHIDNVMKDPTVVFDEKVVLKTRNRNIQVSTDLLPFINPIKKSEWKIMEEI
jgi:leucyl aminopeptidase (aminopeptidase T)